MLYAQWYIGSVEYGSTPSKSKHYSWDKQDRARFTEKRLAEALNLAYDTGYNRALTDMQSFANDKARKADRK